MGNNQLLRNQRLDSLGKALPTTISDRGVACCAGWPSHDKPPQEAAPPLSLKAPEDKDYSETRDLRDGDQFKLNLI